MSFRKSINDQSWMNASLRTDVVMEASLPKVLLRVILPCAFARRRKDCIPAPAPQAEARTSFCLRDLEHRVDDVHQRLLTPTRRQIAIVTAIDIRRHESAG
ncbi:hypothetical protein BIW11_03450 [Tropilaelaps mercedesae]|uniref:Uncharacterized protein n=1 Tax=Tropilaelaps mercedesae TaxID=418985 RepID=A0A1V9XL64_9ACAR|nr:hypothetical protein BIW11_03450 [Tropilaelaps mercedesae]